MSKLVVFQWGRLGDLVQTGIVLNRWRAQIGGTISLVYDRRYRDVVDALADVDNGIPVDIQLLVESARRDADAKGALAVLNEIVGNTPSLIGGAHLVLSRSPSTALMSLLLEPDRQLGYTWVRGVLHEPDLLRDYLNESDSLPYPIHICDAWSMLAELECTPPDVCERFDLSTRSNRILIFADAGESYRTPPANWLRDLGEVLIHRQEHRLTFIGSKRGLKDDPITQLSITHRNSVLDLRGRTSLKNVIELCRNHETVIGPDTGGLHLSAACGCRTIGLYFGGASVYNTGPYCEHAAVLQNPEWTQEELETVLQLIHNENPSHASRVWRSEWDAGSMTYLNDTVGSRRSDEIRNARIDFLKKWTTRRADCVSCSQQNSRSNEHAVVGNNK
jgi:hypothetical protein